MWWNQWEWEKACVSPNAWPHVRVAITVGTAVPATWRPQQRPNSSAYPPGDWGNCHLSLPASSFTSQPASSVTMLPLPLSLPLCLLACLLAAKQLRGVPTTGKQVVISGALQRLQVPSDDITKDIVASSRLLQGTLTAAGWAVGHLWVDWDVVVPPGCSCMCFWAGSLEPCGGEFIAALLATPGV